LNVVAGLLYQFNRQWVVPMVTISDKVHIIYGDVCFRWDTLVKTVKRLSDAILEDKSGVNPNGPIEAAKMREVLPLMPNVTTINFVSRFGEVRQASSQGMGEVYRIFDECYVDGRMGMVKSSSWKWLTVV
jgi:hypothetical protein